MAATGKTPILLYGSTTATNQPSAGNLTNSSDGCEIAINVADKNLFFKDSTNVVNTVPIRQSSTSSNGWLSSTDWTTFNNKASTTSPTFSGNVTVSTGNLVIGTSGKGIDFSATPGTGTSELLADYEEGTWTPTVTSQSGTITSYTSSGTYTKIGREVFVNFTVVITNAGTGSGGLVVSLPYTVGQNTTGVARERALTGTLCQCTSDTGATSTTLFTYSNLSPVVTNYNLTGSLTFTV